MRKKTPQRERDVEEYLIERVAKLGGETRKLKYQGRDGAPDRLILLPGRHIFIELKRPQGGVTKKIQSDERALLVWGGAEAYIVNNKAAVDYILKGRGSIE